MPTPQHRSSKQVKRVLSKLKGINTPAGSELLLFLFFVLVSCCLWLMLTLNRDYETDLKFNLSVKEVPEDVSFSSQDEELIVRVGDRGTTLMNYKLESFLPISVNYSELVNRKGRLTLPVAQLQKRIKKQLASSTAIISIHPDTLLYYTQESAVRYPVLFNGNVAPARQYALGDIVLSPDSVWVFAPAQVTDTLKYLSTAFFEKEELRDTLRIALPLQYADNVNCNPAEVNVTMPVYPFTQKSFDLPVHGIDFPDTYRLRTFPSRVQVKLNVKSDDYDLVNADDFEVGVSYLDIYGSDSNRAEVKLLRAPSWVKDVRIVPENVEYIIEQQ